MKKYSIEYAHIYTNENIEKERGLEKSILDEIFAKYKKEDSCLVVMVDDYSFPDPTFSYNDFKKSLESLNYPVDFSIRESQLIEDCDTVLSELEDQKLKEEIIKYIKEKKKYPCSLFIATWYLIRLGKIKSKIFDEKYTGEHLINILPKSFETFEDKGFEIIKNTKYSHLLENIENRYFEGRQI